MSYDKVYNQTSVKDGNGNVTCYDYDALNRLVEKSYYNEAGNVTELGYPDGTKVTYTYDLNNNLLSVTEPDGDTTTYTYDALNRVTATLRPDFTASYMTYDEESNLTVLKNVCTHCDEILSKYHYTYNEMGYVDTEEVTERVSVYCGKYHGGKEHGNFWRGRGHEYCQHEWFGHDDDKDTIALLEAEGDSQGEPRVMGEKKGGRWHKNPAYLYCTCHTKLVTTKKSYVYDNNWQILACTTEAKDKQISKEAYTYDEAGNRTSYERYQGLLKAEYIRYEYNKSNQLTATYEQEGYDWLHTKKTSYQYDKDGNLIKEKVSYGWFEDWFEDEEDKGGWFDPWWDDWLENWWNGLLGGLGWKPGSDDNNQNTDKPGSDKTDADSDKDSYGYITTTYTYTTENRLKAVREQGVLLQAMTYDGDGNLMYELDYNPEAVVDDRCIYFPDHGTQAERDLYREICDNRGWVRGDYTLTEYLNDVTKENPEVLAEYGKNYCSMTVYTYGNERISATTFNGYGYHFGCHDNGYHDIFHSYLSWHTRWKIQDPWHHKGHHNGHRSYANVWYYGNPYHFTKAYGHHSFYHRGDHCDHHWKTAMSKIYYLYDGHGSVERVHGKDGSSFRMEYDTYGNLIAGIVEKWHAWYSNIFAHRTVSIYAYSGERYNCVSELQYLRARWYDTDTGRFISEDSYLGTLENPLSRNRYIYTNNNPVNYVDPSGHEKIVVSGGIHDNAKSDYMFIETALHDIDVLINEHNEPSEDITWMVISAGYLNYQLKNFETTAEKLGINFVTIKDKCEFANYINSKSVNTCEDINPRDSDKITYFSVFAHGQTPKYSGGTETQLSFAYKVFGVDKEEIDFKNSDIQSLREEAFLNTSSYFYACNIGTDDYSGTSFAQEWANLTDGNVVAIRNGRSEYSFINSTGMNYGDINIAIKIPEVKSLSASDYWNGAMEKIGLETSDEWKEKRERKKERSIKCYDDNGIQVPKDYSDKGSLSYPVLTCMLGDADIYLKDWLNLWEIMFSEDITAASIACK